MRMSPLRLENYFFTKIDLEANSGDCVDDIHLDKEMGIAKHQQDEHKWMVNLSVGNKGHEGEYNPSYKFRVDIVGFFRVADEYPEEKAQGLVAFNGPAVLFGAVREMLANITARGPHKALILPTVTFVDGPANGEEKKIARKTSKQKKSISTKATPQKRKAAKKSKKKPE